MQHQTAYVNSESISLSSGLCFSFGGCYLYSYLHLHDPNVMQVSDHLCPSQLNVLPFIFYFPSFTSPAISFAFLILTTVQLFCAAATYKSTRIRPIESSKRKRRGKSSARDERKRRRLMQKEKRRGKREAAEKRGRGGGKRERQTERERRPPPGNWLEVNRRGRDNYRCIVGFVGTVI